MESNYISIQDISIALLWFIILLTFSFYKRNQIQNLEIKKYYIRNILFKFSFAIFFSIIYIVYYGGGDTTAYWDGAVTLNKLFFSAPVDYFNHLISEPTNALRAMHFSADTGYPPVGFIESQKLGTFVSWLLLSQFLHLGLILQGHWYLHFLRHVHHGAYLRWSKNLKHIRCVWRPIVYCLCLQWVFGARVFQKIQWFIFLFWIFYFSLLTSWF